ncbi:MAG: TlpA family protein disulfide reductase [Hyphomicrobiaceae bacterium]
MSLAALDGPRITLSAPQGGIVIVHFFATWCETCGPELHALQRLQSDFGSCVTIIIIDVGEPADRIRRYFQTFPARPRIGLDADRSVARAWGVYALPSSFVLDHSLAPLWQAIGDVPWDEAAVRQRLSKAGGTGQSSDPRQPTSPLDAKGKCHDH